MESTKRTNGIRHIVQTIVESKILNKEEYFAQEYPNFKEKYPVLFTTVCGRNVDINTLSFMLNVLEKMENTDLTQYDASAEVGQMLYTKYVEPNLPQKEKENKN